MTEQLELMFPDLGHSYNKNSDLLDLIPVGRQNSISMTLLSSITKLSPREIRRKIHNARISGKVICSDSSGYYFPETKSELQRYVLKERKSGSSKYEALRSAEIALMNMTDEGEFIGI